MTEQRAGVIELTIERIREHRLRRMAERQGLRLEQSRVRNPEAHEHSGFMIVYAKANVIVAGGSPMAYSLSLDDVETWLAEPKIPD